MTLEYFHRKSGRICISSKSTAGQSVERDQSSPNLYPAIAGEAGRRLAKSLVLQSPSAEMSTGEAEHQAKKR